MRKLDLKKVHGIERKWNQNWVTLKLHMWSEIETKSKQMHAKSEADKWCWKKVRPVGPFRFPGSIFRRPGEGGGLISGKISAMISMVILSRSAPQAGLRRIKSSAKYSQGRGKADFGAIGNFFYQQSNDRKSIIIGPKCVTGRFCRCDCH